MHYINKYYVQVDQKDKTLLQTQHHEDHNSTRLKSKEAEPEESLNIWS